MKHICKTCGKEICNLPNFWVATNIECVECEDNGIQHEEHFKPQFGHAISFGETGNGGEPRKAMRKG